MEDVFAFIPEGYQFIVDFHRTKAPGNRRGDKFSWDIEAVGERTDELSYEDIRAVLPRGEVRLQAKGWRSFFIIPFYDCQGNLWVSVGVEQVVPHETREAYPIAKAFLFQYDASHREVNQKRLINAMKRLKHDIETDIHNLESTGIMPTCVVPSGLGLPGLPLLPVLPDTYRVLSATRERHMYVENKILEWAIKKFEGNNLVAFKTLLFSIEEHPIENRRVRQALPKNLKFRGGVVLELLDNLLGTFEDVERLLNFKAPPSS